MPRIDMADRANVLYVYGVVPATFTLAHSPTGLDETSIEAIANGDLTAVISRLESGSYSPEIVERDTANMDWMAPRAVAHDRVLTWLSDRGPVVPFPMFSLFSNADTVRAMLREREHQLRSLLERASAGREYALRVYRLDDELRAAAAELSPRLAELQQAASGASPGQRYLLERKLEAERKTELRAIGARVAREVVEGLRPFSAGVAEGRLVPQGRSGAAEIPLVLDAAFLIAPERLDAFRRELTTLVAQHSSHGFRFDFTGPWPPYHFVEPSADGGSHGA